MNAKEAREQALSLKAKANEDLLKNIKDDIKVKVSKGELSTTLWNKPITDVVKWHLTNEGFKIEYFDEGRNEYSYKISW